MESANNDDLVKISQTEIEGEISILSFTSLRSNTYHNLLGQVKMNPFSIKVCYSVFTISKGFRYYDLKVGHPSAHLINIYKIFRDISRLTLIAVYVTS